MLVLRLPSGYSEKRSAQKLFSYAQPRPHYIIYFCYELQKKLQTNLVLRIIYRSNTRYSVTERQTSESIVVMDTVTKRKRL